jgi:hypothetical protein
MINRLTIFYIFLLFFLGCKKKEPTESYCQQNVGNCQSINEAKDYFAFKVGTWWVYEEENTLQRDSMYVIESYINQSNYDFNIRIQSSLTGYRYHYWPEYYPNISGCSNPNAVFNNCLNVKISKGKSSDFVGSKECMFFKSKINDYIYQPSGNSICVTNILKLKEKYNSFNNSMIDFKETLVWEDNCDILDNNQKTNIYYSKFVGIIRKELLDSNQVWNLVKFHIEK